MNTLLAHNGVDHSAGATDEHTGHVQSTTTEQTPAATTNNSSNLMLVGGIIAIAVIAAVAVWILQSRKKTHATVKESPTEE